MYTSLNKNLKKVTIHTNLENRHLHKEEIILILINLNRYPRRKIRHIITSLGNLPNLMFIMKDLIKILYSRIRKKNSMIPLIIVLKKDLIMKEIGHQSTINRKKSNLRGPDIIPEVNKIHLIPSQKKIIST